MLHAALDITDRIADANPVTHSAVADYERVRDVIAYITTNRREQPTVERIAEATGLTATELHHLFRRWSGLSPKAFLQAVTLDAAKGLLSQSASLLDASLDLGLSGPGRLHDLFVTHEALSPGEWKAGAEGLTLAYGFHPSPFGEAIVVATPRGLAGIGFVEGGARAPALADMQRRWPRAVLAEDAAATAPYAARAFEPSRWRASDPLRVVFIGTDWEVRVWEALLEIPLGRAVTYSDIAARVDAPKAARAVGAAVGRNPISFVVPCHRVIGKSGALTGYHWGVTRKQAMLGWERGVGGPN